MQNKTVDFLVGLFVIAGLAALVMLSYKVGNFGGTGGQKGYQVTAQFENIGGLTDKSPVRMAGVDIGRITDIDLDSDSFSAKVTMMINEKYNELPLDTSASILTSGLIGTNYIGLEAGGDFDYLKQGSEIEITQSAVVLENLIGKFLFNMSNSKSGESQ